MAMVDSFKPTDTEAELHAMLSDDDIGVGSFDIMDSLLDDSDRTARQETDLPPARPPPSTAAGRGAPEPPECAAEVDFDVVDPPSTPIEPPGATAVLESAALMAEHDVFCGTGSKLNDHEGNRRFWTLVLDLRPTYLAARRCEKAGVARSVVLILRRRGGRFLRRNVADGGLYEVGDAKGEAKALRALAAGTDRRPRGGQATVAPAITLSGQHEAACVSFETLPTANALPPTVGNDDATFAAALDSVWMAEGEEPLTLAELAPPQDLLENFGDLPPFQLEDFEEFGEFDFYRGVVGGDVPVGIGDSAGANATSDGPGASNPTPGTDQLLASHSTEPVQQLEFACETEAWKAAVPPAVAPPCPSHSPPVVIVSATRSEGRHDPVPPRPVPLCPVHPEVQSSATEASKYCNHDSCTKYKQTGCHGYCRTHVMLYADPSTREVRNVAVAANAETTPVTPPPFHSVPSPMNTPKPCPTLPTPHPAHLSTGDVQEIQRPVVSDSGLPVKPVRFGQNLRKNTNEHRPVVPPITHLPPTNNTPQKSRVVLQPIEHLPPRKDSRTGDVQETQCCVMLELGSPPSPVMSGQGQGQVGSGQITPSCLPFHLRKRDTEKGETRLLTGVDCGHQHSCRGIKQQKVEKATDVNESAAADVAAMSVKPPTMVTAVTSPVHHRESLVKADIPPTASKPGVNSTLKALVSAATADPTLWNSPTFAVAMAAVIEQSKVKPPAPTKEPTPVAIAVAASAVTQATVVAPSPLKAPILKKIQSICTNERFTTVAIAVAAPAVAQATMLAPGTPKAPILKKTQSKCIHEGCTNIARKGGICLSHGGKRASPMCKHAGCTKHVINRGLCTRHGAKKRFCTHEACTNVVVKGGVCWRHGAKQNRKPVDTKDAIMRFSEAELVCSKV